MESLLSMFTPELGGVAQFGLGIWNAAEAKKATSMGAWSKWEADTVQAIRKAAEIDKQNFRAFEVDLENWYKQNETAFEILIQSHNATLGEKTRSCCGRGLRTEHLKEIQRRLVTAQTRGR